MGSEFDMVIILDNSDGRKVIESLKSLIKDAKEACFAVGYFYLSGWNLLKESLPKKAKPSFLKILIGRELNFPTYEEISKGYKLRIKTRLLDDLNDIEEKDISSIEKLYKLISKGIVDINIFHEGRLHSKLYLFLDRPKRLEDGSHGSPGAAIVGSSNFTLPGTIDNMELNTELTDATQIKYLNKWFKDLWENHSEPFNEELIKIIDASKVLFKKEKNPIGKYLSPKNLFKYLSWIWLRGKIEPIEKEDILAKFQLVGVLNAIEMISEFNGAIIADSVGLGKSFIGATIIEEYILGKIPDWIPNLKAKSSMERRTLLILPPSLIKQWKSLFFESGDFFSKNITKDISKDDRFVQYTIYGSNSLSEGIIGEIAFLSLGKFQNMDPEEIYKKDLQKNYDLILIDEAHKFRNNWTNRFKNVQALRYKTPEVRTSHRNKFVLLTATPINNNIWDVYNLIKIFSDDNFTNFKKRNINVSELFSKYRKVKQKWKENKKEEGNLRVQAQVIKDKIFKKVIILRTRKYIMDEFGKDGKIFIRDKAYSFSDPVPDKITYKSETETFEQYNKFLELLEKEFERLEFSFTKLYSSGFVAFKKQGSDSEEESQKIMVPINAILEFLLAKRLESSIFAFERTLSKLAFKNNLFFKILEEIKGKIEDLNNQEFLQNLREFSRRCIEIAQKEDTVKEFEEDEIDIEEKRIDPRLRLIFNLLSYGSYNVDPLLERFLQKESDFYEFLEKSEKKVEIIESLKAGLKLLHTELKKDKEIFDNIKENLNDVKYSEKSIIKFVGEFSESGKNIKIPKYIDPKIEKLKRLIYEKLIGKKYIIFTQYKDTAKYLYNTLVKWIKRQKSTLNYLFTEDKLKIAMVSGESDIELKNRIIDRFAPIANNAQRYINDDEIEILVSTDTLSEGVNLQDAHGVINFDLPWNPMKIVQRVGRVNRIGSEKEIFVKNFNPTKELEAIIGILEKLSNKIQDITILIGKEFYILSEDEEISPEIFEKKIKDLAAAKMSQLEEISKVGDSKFFDEIEHKEEIAKFRLLNFIQNELKLRKDDFEEIHPYLEKDNIYYTLINPKEFVRIYDLYRGNTIAGRYILKKEENQIIETTCQEFIKLWDTEELQTDLDISNVKKNVEKMDKHFQKVYLESAKGLKTQGGFIGKLYAELRNLKIYKRIKPLEIDREKLNKLIDYLPLVEMNTFEIKSFNDYLLDSECISKNKSIKDYKQLVDLSFEYLKPDKDTFRKLNYKVKVWWC